MHHPRLLHNCYTGVKTVRNSCKIGQYVWIDWQDCNRCENVCETILFRDFARRELAALDGPAA